MHTDGVSVDIQFATFISKWLYVKKTFPATVYEIMIKENIYMETMKLERKNE